MTAEKKQHYRPPVRRSRAPVQIPVEEHEPGHPGERRVTITLPRLTFLENAKNDPVS